MRLPQEFRAATLANYLDHQGKVKVIPRKEKKKIVLLTYFSESIPKNQCFSEQEINQLIQVVFADFAAIRRYLIDYGFLSSGNRWSEILASLNFF